MTYVEGFVVAVPAANKQAYLAAAEAFAPLLREFGATRHVEAWGDDVPDGQVTDYRRAVKAEDGEVIVFSWIEYPSRAVRDTANERIRSDPRVDEMGACMPFDARRMIYGGFAKVVDEGGGEGMGYLDGALLAVPAAAKDAYLGAESRIVQILREHGALRVVEAWEDDAPEGEITDFKGAVKADGAEKVVFSWIEWPSRAARDEAWRKVVADPRMHELNLPYDPRRRVHGGFEPIWDSRL